MPGLNIFNVFQCPATIFQQIQSVSIVFNVSSISIYSIIAICAIGQYIVVPALKGSTVDASAIFQCLHNAGQCR
jgi:hypothetical protein